MFFRIFLLLILFISCATTNTKAPQSENKDNDSYIESSDKIKEIRKTTTSKDKTSKEKIKEIVTPSNN
ncbi:hypothetical protein HN450_03110 [bacterium]|jgi:hypothetical protein|nr:hypothetical protein [bacterium]MBT3850052.1 hypothetical protein [bacterium]